MIEMELKRPELCDLGIVQTNTAAQSACYGDTMHKLIVTKVAERVNRVMNPDTYHLMGSIPELYGYMDEKGPFLPVKMPFLFIINGAAGTGKDTFVQYCIDAAKKISTVFENENACVTLSSVDKCYEAINGIFLGSDHREAIQRDIKTKGDNWRQFMHEVKMSWSKYCNGPTQYLMDQIYKETTEHCASFIFMMLREASEIKTFVDTLGSCGYYIFSIFIDGYKTADDWKNDCDHNVHKGDFEYDFVFENKGLKQLKNYAHVFMSEIIRYYQESDEIPYFKYRFPKQQDNTEN